MLWTILGQLTLRETKCIVLSGIFSVIISSVRLNSFKFSWTLLSSDLCNSRCSSHIQYIDQTDLLHCGKLICLLKVLVYQRVTQYCSGRHQSLGLVLWRDVLKVSFVCSLAKQIVILAICAKPLEFVVSGRYVVDVILESWLNTMQSTQSPSCAVLQNLLLLRYSLSAS